MLAEIKGTCQWNGCKLPATAIACGREYLGTAGHPAPAYYCETHARIVADEGLPEYIVHCPNCGCYFGEN